MSFNSCSSCNFSSRFWIIPGNYSYRNEDGEDNTFPIAFEEIGLSADDVVKYINQLVVENANFSDLIIEDDLIYISYFNQMSGEDKNLKLTISEVEDDPE